MAPYYLGNNQIVYIGFNYVPPYWYGTVKEYKDDKKHLVVQGSTFSNCKSLAMDYRLVSDFLKIR